LHTGRHTLFTASPRSPHLLDAPFLGSPPQPCCRRDMRTHYATCFSHGSFATFLDIAWFTPFCTFSLLSFLLPHAATLLPLPYFSTPFGLFYCCTPSSARLCTHCLCHLSHFGPCTPHTDYTDAHYSPLAGSHTLPLFASHCHTWFGLNHGCATHAFSRWTTIHPHTAHGFYACHTRLCVSFQFWFWSGFATPFLPFSRARFESALFRRAFCWFTVCILFGHTRLAACCVSLRSSVHTHAVLPRCARSCSLLPPWFTLDRTVYRFGRLVTPRSTAPALRTISRFMRFARLPGHHVTTFYIYHKTFPGRYTLRSATRCSLRVPPRPTHYATGPVTGLNYAHFTFSSCLTFLPRLPHFHRSKFAHLTVTGSPHVCRLPRAFALPLFSSGSISYTFLAFHGLLHLLRFPLHTTTRLGLRTAFGSGWLPSLLNLPRFAAFAVCTAWTPPRGSRSGLDTALRVRFRTTPSLPFHCCVRLVPGCAGSGSSFRFGSRLHLYVCRRFRWFAVCRTLRFSVLRAPPDAGYHFPGFRFHTPHFSFHSATAFTYVSTTTYTFTWTPRTARFHWTRYVVLHVALGPPAIYRVWFLAFFHHERLHPHHKVCRAHTHDSSLLPPTILHTLPSFAWFYLFFLPPFPFTVSHVGHATHGFELFSFTFYVAFLHVWVPSVHRFTVAHTHHCTLVLPGSVRYRLPGCTRLVYLCYATAAHCLPAFWILRYTRFATFIHWFFTFTRTWFTPRDTGFRCTHTLHRVLWVPSRTPPHVSHFTRFAHDRHAYHLPAFVSTPFARVRVCMFVWFALPLRTAWTPHATPTPFWFGLPPRLTRFYTIRFTCHAFTKFATFTTFHRFHSSHHLCYPDLPDFPDTRSTSAPTDVTASTACDSHWLRLTPLPRFFTYLAAVSLCGRCWFWFLAYFLSSVRFITGTHEPTALQ